MKLCSACLLGVKCRYDDKDAFNEKILEVFRKEILIPICPEIFAGFNVPREKAEEFLHGAEKVLKLAKRLGVKEAIMKQNSPSCWKASQEDGVVTALLKANGIKVISEDEL